MEGAAEVRLLVERLKKIEGREDLVDAEPVLKKHFEKIVDIAIQARIFQQKNPGEEVRISEFGKLRGDALLEQMKRVYAIEGGRACIERVQREAMLRLDAKEKMLEKQQSKMRHFN